MKTISTVVLLSVIPLLLIAQQVNKEAIRAAGKYFYGTGVSFDEQEARDRALAELTQQIAVRVANSFRQKLTETDRGLEEDVEAVLQTHSAATLKNVQMIKQPLPDGRIEVFCYISKDEVSKIFDERKRLIYHMFQKAQQYENLANYAYALKLNYFALLLVNSVPDQNIVVDGVNLTLEIPERINQIFGKIRFQKVKDVLLNKDEREITLRVTGDGRPVALLDFTFWDGQNQVQVTARDGLATFHLLGPSVNFDELKLAIKYAYYDARDEFKVVADLWPLVDKPVFNSTVVLSLKEQPVEAGTQVETTATGWNLKLTFEGEVPVIEKIQQATAQFLNLLKEGNPQKMAATYANDAFLRNKVLNYLKYNHPRPLDDTVQAQINKTALGYELRRVRVLHEYPSLHKQSTEYLVLDFDHDGNLIDLNTSISENLYQNFVQQSQFGKDWKERQTIIKFVEKYRTAYLVRDLQTINLMFADDALIIVGRKIERKKLPKDVVRYQRFEKQPDYQYIRLTKEKYLQRLQRVFEAQQDIFLNYGSFRMIRKNNVKGVYGVEMRQSYHSTTYSDEGYLFLLIDFREADPLIYVRAWQPNEWNDSVLVRTANFRIYK